MTTSRKIDSRLPDFIVVGAGKCGTTSLDYYLSTHPDVFMCPVKEPNFFALEGKYIPPPEDDPEQFFHYPQAVTEKGAYLNLFNEAKEGQLLGEVSPMYLYSPEAAQRIYDNNPDTKIIAILRQPSERLYSRYMHLARQSELPTPHFSDALDKSTIWWRRDDLVNEGFFYRGLKRYYDLFPKENIKVYLHEDLKYTPQEVMESMFSFIGLENKANPDFGLQFNQSGIIKNKFFDVFIGQKSIVKNMIEKISPNAYEAIKKNPTLQKIVQRARNKNLERPPVDKEVKTKLTQEVYREDILQLQNLLGRDLSAWLR